MFEKMLQKSQMVTAENALQGRAAPLEMPPKHFVLGRDLQDGIPDGFERAMFGMGCFWGVERMFWSLKGVWVTSVGYAGGYTPHASYEEVCTGKTGHNEVVQVVFDPQMISYAELLKVFWEGHDPTQGMRQGNDRGTQYRSGIYTYSDAQMQAAQTSKSDFAPVLRAAGYGAITTEVIPAPPYYLAEGYHQQYLAKNPNGYCGIGGTGAVCPIGVAQSKAE